MFEGVHSSSVHYMWMGEKPLFKTYISILAVEDSKMMIYYTEKLIFFTARNEWEYFKGKKSPS